MVKFIVCNNICDDIATKHTWMLQGTTFSS